MSGRGRPPPAATRLLAEVLRPERKPLAALVVVLLVAMLLPLAGPAIVGQVVDDALAGEPLSDLTLLAGLYLVVAAAAEGLQLLLTWASVQVAWRAGNRLREKAADHALSLDLDWHSRHTPGELISRIDGDAEALTTFGANVVVQVVGNLVLVAGVVVVCFVIDWRIGVVVTITAAATVARDGRDARLRRRRQRGRAGGVGPALRRRRGAAGRASRTCAPTAAVRTRCTASRRRRRGCGTPPVEAGGRSTARTPLAAGHLRHRLRGDAGRRRVPRTARGLSLGVVLAVFRYTQMMRNPLERAAEQLPELQRALAGASRTARLLAEEPSLRWRRRRRRRHAAAGRPRRRPRRRRAHLRRRTRRAALGRPAPRAGHDARRRRPDRQRQDDARPAAAPVLGSRPRATCVSVAST